MSWSKSHLGFSLLAAACGTADPRAVPPPNAVPDASITVPESDSGVITPARDGSSGCINLQCQREKCPDGGTTSLSGTVFAPNGTLPLYNVLVFVPNEELKPIPKGLVCDRCGGAPPGKPVSAALTDAHGNFVLNDVPVGTNIPLVMQLGKWRRQVHIPAVRKCEENKLLDFELTRLPKNQSEGEMPRIAVTTGGCDNLICLFPKLGIDPQEFGVAGDDKAVTLYHGSPSIRDSVDRARFDAHLQQMTEAETLWGNLDELKKYDVAMFSCECEESADKKGAVAYQAVTDYLNAGGRVFGTDYQYIWYKNTPDPGLKATVSVRGGAPNANNPVTLDTTFAKGKALAEWLVFTDPTRVSGEVSCQQVFENFTSVAPPAAQIWGTSPSLPYSMAEAGPIADGDGASGAAGPRFFTVNTPVGRPAEQQCGKAVHLDAHITTVIPLFFQHYPDDCAGGFVSSEQTLAFMFFDLASCIQDDSKPPPPPDVH